MNDRPGNFGRKRPLGGALGDGTARCAAPGCALAGEFRAPRQPHEPGSGRWKYLCLDHVRQFNASYDFFDGMDQEAIYAARHPASGWADRTAWADGAAATPRWQDFTDPLDAIGARYRSAEGRGPPGAQPRDTADSRAYKALGLDPGADARAIRRAYAEKLRRYHPDRNGGDRRHEKALQQVISAYTHLRKMTARG